MAGSITVSYEKLNHGPTSDVGTRIIISWTSSAGGAVSGNTKILIRGLLVRAITVPDGTDVPTANYDVTLPHPSNSTIDLAQALLTNRSETSAQAVEFGGVAALTNGSPIYINGAIDFTVANAGNAKKGVCILEVLH
jgi:hypothetical protein